MSETKSFGEKNMELGNILDAVKIDGSSLRHVNKEMKNSKLVVMEAVKQNGSSLRYASEELKNDMDVVLEALKSTGSALEYASPEMRDVDVVVLEAVKKYGYSLEYASERLKNDKDVVLAAVGKHPSSFEFASEEMKKDKEIVVEVVKISGSLDFVSEELKSDPDVAIEAVKRNGSSFRKCGRDLRNNKSFVLDFLEHGDKPYRYFRHVGKEMKDDVDVVLKAVQHNKNLLLHASDRLQREKSIVREVVRKDGSLPISLVEKIKNDENIIFALMEDDPSHVKFASFDLFNDRKFVLKALEYSYEGTFNKIGHGLKYDPEILLKAVKHIGSTILGEIGLDGMKIQKDREFFFEAVKMDGLCIQYTSEKLKNDWELAVEAVKQNASSLRFVGIKLKEKLEFMIEVVRKNGMALEYVSRKNEKFVLEALRNCGFAYRFAPKKLRLSRKFFFGKALKVMGNNRKVKRQLVMEGMKCVFFVEIMKKHGEEWENDKTVILGAVKYGGGGMFRYSGEELRRDKNAVLEAVKIDVLSFHHAHEELKIDREFVKEVMKIDCSALKLASGELRKDREFILGEIEANSETLLHVVGEGIEKDKEFLMDCLKRNGRTFEFVDGEFRKDKEFVIHALKHIRFEQDVAKHIDEELFGDEEFQKELLSVFHSRNDDNEVYIEALRNGVEFRNFDEDMKNDMEIVIEALKVSQDNTRYVNEEMKNDKEVVIEVLKNHNVFIGGAKLTKDKGFIVELIIKYKLDPMHVSGELWDDKQFALDLFESSGESSYLDILRFFSEDLKNDREVVFAAASSNVRNLLFAGNELMNETSYFEECLEKNGFIRILKGNEFKFGDGVRNNKPFLLGLLEKYSSLYVDSSKYRKKYEYIFKTIFSFRGKDIWDDREFLSLVLSMKPDVEVTGVGKEVMEEVRLKSTLIELSKKIENDERDNLLTLLSNSSTGEDRDDNVERLIRERCGGHNRLGEWGNCLRDLLLLFQIEARTQDDVLFVERVFEEILKVELADPNTTRSLGLISYENILAAVQMQKMFAEGFSWLESAEIHESSEEDKKLVVKEWEEIGLMR